MTPDEIDIQDNFVQEFEKAVDRFENIFQDATEALDFKTALAAEKERAKLLGLYRVPDLDNHEERETELDKIIREHLEPLGLAPADMPAEELLRLAALKIVTLKSLESLKHAPEKPRSAPAKDADSKPGKVGARKGNRKAAADKKSRKKNSGDV